MHSSFSLIDSNKSFLTALLLLISLSMGKAQKLEYGFPSQAWHTGELTLNDGITLEGKIKYDLETDALHLNSGGNTRTYVANQIEKFHIYQRDIKRQREFISIPFETKAGYKRPKFFEIVYQNATALSAGTDLQQRADITRNFQAIFTVTTME